MVGELADEEMAEESELTRPSTGFMVVVMCAGAIMDC
jgi:hypothetical protein